MLNRLLILLTVSLMNGCVNPPNFSDTPELTFKALSKMTMNQGALNQDSITVKLEFADGDGDIGHDALDPTKDVFVFDARNNTLQDKLKMPFVPEEGTGNGISGDLELIIYNTCCLFPDGIPPCASPPQYPTDTIIYEIYIIDRAGHESNHVFTDPIVLRCN